jgi:putative transposase
MTRKRYTEEQIIGILKESEAGANTQELCRKFGMSDASFYKWKAKFGGMDVSGAGRLKMLGNENSKLIPAHLGLSERRSCRLVGLNRGTHFYKTKSRPLEEAIRKRMREIAEKKRRWGCPLIHKVLKREGLVRNHKRTERLYREEKLSLRTRKRKKRACHLRVEMPVPERANQRWSMDFVSDRIWRGRRFRVFTIVDDYTRECLNDHWFTSLREARDIIEAWRLEYYRDRPHGSLGDLTPQEFATKSATGLYLEVAQFLGGGGMCTALWRAIVVPRRPLEENYFREFERNRFSKRAGPSGAMRCGL